MSQIESDESLERSRLIKASVDPVLDYLAGCFASLQVMQRLRGAVDVVFPQDIPVNQEHPEKVNLPRSYRAQQTGIIHIYYVHTLTSREANSQWILLRASLSVPATFADKKQQGQEIPFM